jgi:hypothetical protein
MNKFLSYVGALIGSFTLAKAAIAGSFLSGLGAVIAFISLLGTVVFSVALIWDGIKTLIARK